MQKKETDYYYIIAKKKEKKEKKSVRYRKAHSRASVACYRASCASTMEMNGSDDLFSAFL
jgi:hypothetical protein